MADIADMAQAFEAQNRDASISAVLNRLSEPQLIEGGQVICLDCGHPVPAERLEILPRTARCVECQMLAEEPLWNRS